jgi:GT2 family glycosyltransferase
MNLPLVGLVIATYLEQNQRYLDECLKSIKNLSYPKDKIQVMVKSSGDYEPTVDLDIPYLHVLHHGRQVHYPESINLGIEELKKRFGDVFDYYLLLNDDTVLTKDSLANLVIGAMGNHMAIYQPVSNCDNHWRYLLPFKAGEKHIMNRFYRYDDLANDFENMRNASSPVASGYMFAEWVALYATLISKKVWDIVGPLDPKFKTGQDDVDYCKRAKMHGIPCVINLSSLIWHFGGVTADVALTPEIRNENLAYFKSKYNGEMPV